MQVHVVVPPHAPRQSRALALDARVGHARPVEERPTSDPLAAVVRVAAAAIALQAAASAGLPELTAHQQLAVATIAGEDLDAALEDLNDHLPGIRAEIDSGVALERVLAEYDVRVSPATDAEGEIVRALVPVAIAAEALRTQAASGVSTDAWRHLEERLVALERTEPVIHARLTAQVETWLADAARDLPPQAP